MGNASILGRGSQSGRQVSDVSKANLKPVKPGEVRNPFGKAGRNGKGGASLKTVLKDLLSNMSRDEQDELVSGIINKARDGDVQAMKLVLSMNDEKLEQVEVDTDNGVRISINMPSKDENKE